ncbi:MAG: TonB-dependent receptor [Pseudomonadota bacterium]
MKLYRYTITALVAIAAVPVVFAQTARDRLIEEVVVTATKKSVVENVQDVPIAITAIGESQMDALKFKDLSDIAFLAPNANLQPITTQGTAFFSIRGVTPTSSILSVDPTVGVFVDGVYNPTGQGTVFDNFDLASIEILRGPQGVLQGRNVVGGAVLVTTKKPTEEFEADLRIRADSGFRGTGEDFTFSGTVTGPLAEGLNGKIAAYRNDDGGWFENEFDGSDWGENEVTILRGALSWDATDSVNFLIQYEYFDQDGTGLVNQSHERQDNRLRPDGSGGFFEKGELDFATEMVGSCRGFEVGPGCDVLDHFFEQRVDSVTFTTTIDVAFGDGTITNIYGWRDLEQTSQGDVDGTPFATFPAWGGNEVEHWSNELRYFGTFGDFDLTTGFYYLDVELASETNQSLRINALPTWMNRSGGGTQESETWGVFANVDYNITDTVTISGGLRWTDEEKSTTSHALNNNRVFEGSQRFVGCGFVVGDGTCIVDLENSDEWSNLSFRAGVTWDVNDDTMMYGSISRSFRAGNFNLRRSNVADDRIPVDEERMDQVEVGVEWDVSDRFRLNAALFVLEATDLQRVALAADLSQTSDNVAKARFTGVELDGRAFITDSLTLTYAIGMNDGEYQDIDADLNADGVVDQTDFGLELPNTPELMYNFGLLHDIQIGDYNLASQLLYTHRDNVFNNDNTASRGSVDTIDVNFALSPNGGNWELSIYGRNLTDQAIYTQSTEINLPDGAHLAGLAKGRRIGAEFRYFFN